MTSSSAEKIRTNPGVEARRKCVETVSEVSGDIPELSGLPAGLPALLNWLKVQTMPYGRHC